MEIKAPWHTVRIGKLTSITEDSPRDLMKTVLRKLQTQHINALKARISQAHSLVFAFHNKGYKPMLTPFISTQDKAS